MKTKISLSVEKDIIDRAHAVGLNVSKICELALIEKTNQLTNPNTQSHVFDEGFSSEESSVVRLPGFEPPASAVRGIWDIDWKAFEETLKGKYRWRGDVSMVNKAMRYAPCLLSGDFSEICLLPKTVVPMVLRSLSALSKFLGLHEEFLRLTKQHGLSWVGRSADDLIIDRLNRSDDPEDVWCWIRDVKEAIPSLRDFMDFVSVTGLRLSEAINAYNLIIQLTEEGALSTKYYNPANGFLEHFRHRDVFIRSSKKAYLSYVPLEMLEVIGKLTPITARHSIQKRFARRHMNQRFGDVREAHATYLLKYLSETEVDVLHGRVSGSVFKVHYLNVKLIPDLRSRCARAAKEILGKIDVGAAEAGERESLNISQNL